MKDTTVNQVLGSTQKIDLAALANELAALRAEMKKQAREPEHDVAVGSIASAEAAAKKGDATSAMQRLSGVGQWALDLAVKIGVPVAIEAIKKSTGF